MSSIMMQLLGGAAGGGQKIFDDYGIFGITFPTTSGQTNTSVTLTEVFTLAGTSQSSNYTAVRAQLLDGAGSGYDPKNARLVTSRFSNNSVQPTFMYPASGYDWSTVSSTSHMTQSAAQFASSSSGAGAYGIGGALYTDTTSTKVISRAIHYAGMTESQYGITSEYTLKDVTNGGYTSGQFNMPTSTNYHSRGESTRYNRGHQSTERMLMNVAKDQNGYLENVSGMPNVIQARVFNSSFSLIGASSTQGAVARTSYDLSSANTHGNHNRAAYLGGRQVGNVHESFYVGIYHDHNNSSNKGRRYVKFSHDLTNDSVTTQVGAHISDSNINSSGGVVSYSNQVYPHAYYSVINSGNANGSIGNNQGQHYYVDLSQTWNNGLSETFAGNLTFHHVARVGTNGNGNPVYFLTNASTSYIYEYIPSQNSWNLHYANNTNVTTPVDNINGVFPIPQTNRIIVSTQAGFTLYELDIP